eukprot:TRINITY_DN41358_c0_g1_i1.p1 TRINITY_DN41358_c0_g1~~TRINITY_DN41358_c0_g1_i1.p1  ORF type:complete len:290 (+),score=44.43 TRINITY_DN41358_c0_g1_i1:82-951(+)
MAPRNWGPWLGDSKETIPPGSRYPGDRNFIGGKWAANPRLDEAPSRSRSVPRSSSAVLHGHGEEEPVFGRPTVRRKDDRPWDKPWSKPGNFADLPGRKHAGRPKTPAGPLLRFEERRPSEDWLPAAQGGDDVNGFDVPLQVPRRPRAQQRDRRPASQHGSFQPPPRETTEVGRLLFEVARSLGQPASEVQTLAAALNAECLSEIRQLRAMAAEDWQRLNLPLVLEMELRRRLGIPPNAVSAQDSEAHAPQGAVGSCRRAAWRRSPRACRLRPGSAPAVGPIGRAKAAWR